MLLRRFSVDGYAPGVARVPKDEHAKLRAIARDLAGARSVRCAGHADGSATPRFARRLGLLRAAAVCSLLANHGVRARLTPVSLGSSRPRATNLTERGRARNRRVVIVVLR